MELELKYLSAYLPYKVYLLMSDGKTKLPMNGIKDDNVFVFDGYSSTIKISKAKPILRPLSDLIIDEDIIEDFIGIGNWCNAYDEYLDSWYPDASYAKEAPYAIFEYFLTNHYDVFGLIDNGLAIDINTIK